MGVRSPSIQLSDFGTKKSDEHFTASPTTKLHGVRILFDLLSTPAPRRKNPCAFRGIEDDAGVSLVILVGVG